MTGGWMQWLLLQMPLFLLAGIGAHLMVSGSQTMLHFCLGHHRRGGWFFRNHVKFHHAYYAKGHLVSSTHHEDDDINTPYFLIPTLAFALACFVVLPFGLFCVIVASSGASFAAHVYLDRAYHMENSMCDRFAWFRRKQQLHFVHHLHANKNFAVIDFFWDRLLGTYQRPTA